MKIGNVGSTKSSGGVKKRGSVSSGGSFADLLGLSGSKSASGPDEASGVSSIAPITNLLAAQEVSGDEQNKTLVKQGEDTLDALERLRHRLLVGNVPMSSLTDIKNRIARQKKHTADPELLGIINEIELRASVELAKLETALANRKAAQDRFPEDN